MSDAAPKNRRGRPPKIKKDKTVLLSILYEGLLKDWVQAGGRYAVVNVNPDDEGGIEGVAVIFEGGLECSDCRALVVRSPDKSPLCNTCRLKAARKKQAEVDKLPQDKAVEKESPVEEPQADSKEPLISGTADSE